MTKAGTRMDDGSVFAGLTLDGKQEIYAMPKDLGVTKTFNDATKAIDKLNADNTLGHKDWQIGSFDVMRVLQMNQNEGSLKDTFKVAIHLPSEVFHCHPILDDFDDYDEHQGSPTFYWSSTKGHDLSLVDCINFSNGEKTWDTKDDGRLSCRPVRLVACKAP